jgi:putative transposase
VACHITQRGVDRRETFSSGDDRHTYLDLLRQNLEDTNVRILAYCLMSNHVHLIAVPGRPDSLSVLMRRVHGRYAQYYNARVGRTGHLWQNRFFGCMLAPSHLWAAVAYVELNPLRARMVRRAEDYVWPSAVAHVAGGDGSGVLDMFVQHRLVAQSRPSGLARTAQSKDTGSGRGPRRIRGSTFMVQLRGCTYAERPFGDEAFVDEMSRRFGRYWNRGLPNRRSKLTVREPSAQFGLFEPPWPGISS